MKADISVYSKLYFAWCVPLLVPSKMKIPIHCKSTLGYCTANMTSILLYSLLFGRIVNSPMLSLPLQCVVMSVLPHTPTDDLMC